MTPFDVILVPFPFSDLSTAKKRPCLVLASFKPKKLKPHVVVAMITSNLSSLEFPHDVAIKDWAQAGLPKPSLIRLDKIVTLDESLITRRLGKLPSHEHSQVKKKLRGLFKEVV